MVDVVDRATRSRMMSGIRGKNTKPEIFLRKRLHALGFRYRLHAKDLLGRPDLVLPKHRVVVFVHGCFWHGHQCRYSKLPTTNSDFWRQKIFANKTHDERVLSALRAQGWRCLVVWECAVRACKSDFMAEMLASRVAVWINGGGPYEVVDGASIALAAARDSE